MGEVERIHDQLKRAFEGEAWHGPSVREVLSGVTAETAAQRPIRNAHSIWEIVDHIQAWQAATRRRIEGEPMKLSPEEDWPAVNATGEAAWKRDVQQLENGYQQLRNRLSSLSDADLEQTVPGEGYTVYFLLHGLIQHNLFHAGQIAVLKKS